MDGSLFRCRGQAVEYLIGHIRGHGGDQNMERIVTLKDCRYLFPGTDGHTKMAMNCVDRFIV